ncbi:MAG: polyprenyl synthetase family protein [Acidobacteriota bacterium]
MTTPTVQPPAADPPSTARSFTDFLRAARAPIDDALDALLPGAEQAPGRLHEAVRYSVFAGGKRVRPALVLLTGDALRVPHSQLLPGAAALEMIHTYSLVHDDLPALDNDDLRRGRPTCHRQYDEATAILVGDTLLTLGLTTLAAQPADVEPARRQQATAMVGEAIGSLGMIGGQVADLEATHGAWPDDPAAALESIHRRKTGALLAACVRLAGIYAGRGPDDARLVALGDALGLLFQIGDDILDVEGSDAALGKTAGKDAAAHKLTYPALHGLDASKALLRATAARARDAADGLPEGPGLFPSLIDFLVTRDR